MKIDLSDIKAVLFDLDDTIFDHRKVQKLSLKELYRDYHHVFSGIPFRDFYSAYIHNNEILWALIERGAISKKQLRLRRISDFLREFNLDASFASEMTRHYLTIYSRFSFLIPGVKSTIRYLYKKYMLGIITNGFFDIQSVKIDRLGFSHLFKSIVLSEDAGAMKPQPEIFRKAISELGCSAEECIFVGDSYDSDIIGARHTGMVPIWYNPAGKNHPEDSSVSPFIISSMNELTGIL